MTSARLATSPIALWSGRVLTALPILAMVGSAAMKLTRNPHMLAELGKFGYAPSTIFAIGLVELCAVALFAFPRTSFLGALLLTAYLGGATATHVRVGDPFAVPVVLGVIVWAALFVRDGRLRGVLLPPAG